MADFEFGEKINLATSLADIQTQIDQLQKNDEKKKLFLETLKSIAEKNAELGKKLASTKNEMGNLLLETVVKAEQGCAVEYAELIKSHLPPPPPEHKK